VGLPCLQLTTIIIIINVFVERHKVVTSEMLTSKKLTIVVMGKRPVKIVMKEGHLSTESKSLHGASNCYYSVKSALC